MTSQRRLVRLGRGSRSGRPPAAVLDDVGRLGPHLLLAVAVYTLVVALAPGASLWDWLNTLFATVLSVAAALVVGLALFEYQTGETDRRQKEELVRLLEAELGEIARGMRERPSKVNSWIHDRDTFAPLQFTARLEQHHPNPLIAEEAVKSGMFGAEATAKLLVLSRLMRAHSSILEEAVGFSFTVMGREGSEIANGQDARERMRYGTAALAVVSSEERIATACEEVLGLLRREADE